MVHSNYYFNSTDAKDLSSSQSNLASSGTSMIRLVNIHPEVKMLADLSMHVESGSHHPEV